MKDLADLFDDGTLMDKVLYSLWRRPHNRDRRRWTRPWCS
jgi:hypothetical protein